jgi:hypothetical protein
MEMPTTNSERRANAPMAPPWVRPGIGYDLVDSAEEGHIAMLGPDRRRVERPDPGNPPEPFADLAV